jgi:hypothetical protein
MNVSVLDTSTFSLSCLSCALYYKCFTIVIYDHNDSGQYYKTTIMIVIDNPS